MSIETDATAEDDRSVESLATQLGEAIADLPEYQAFMEAKETVEADEDAQEAIQEFEQIREEYVTARQMGQASQEDLRELQQAQEELHDLPVMSAYLQAQNDLELRLQALNMEISEPLAVDFGEKAGGCCHD
ncbi:YlbF family regulator [Halobacteriales archaeon Cl-PHB]